MKERLNSTRRPSVHLYRRGYTGGIINTFQEEIMGKDSEIIFIISKVYIISPKYD